MRILFLAARLPYPLDTGGKIRAYNILKALCSEHEVTLLYMCDGERGAREAEELPIANVRALPVVNRRINKRFPVGPLLGALLDARPVNVLKYNPPRLKAAIEEALSSGRYDAVHCEHMHVACSIGRHPGIRTVLDAHNVESDITRRLVENAASPAKRALLAWHHKRMLAYEQGISRQFDMIFAVSEKDRAALEEMRGAGDVVTVENGVDTAFFRPLASRRERSAVFLGSMDWWPNSDGAKYFAENVMPLLWKSHGDVALTIVGRNPPPEIAALADRDSRIVVTGTVGDVRPYLASAAVVVVPLRVGGGTRLKVLEAFSMGKAVVTTSLGIEGIEHAPGRDSLVADTPDAFAAAVGQVLDDEALAARLGKNARRLACERYGWSAIGRKVLAAYAELESRPSMDGGLLAGGSPNAKAV